MEKNLADFSDDSYLLEEIKRGNEEAFVYLFKNYFPRLRGYAIRFIEDEDKGGETMRVKVRSV